MRRPHSCIYGETDLEGMPRALRFDDRRDVNGVDRMSTDHDAAVRIMAGRTPLGRRLAMVANVDLVVTISGSVHREFVVEQALGPGIPVVPIPDGGGSSAALLDRFHDTCEPPPPSSQM
jgi:hypothetical protein